MTTSDLQRGDYFLLNEHPYRVIQKHHDGSVDIKRACIHPEAAGEVWYWKGNFDKKFDPADLPAHNRKDLPPPA